MARCCEDIRLRPHLDGPAEIHHDHVVGDVSHHGKVVGDEEIGESVLLLQVDQEVQDRGLDREVERRDRLVEHEKAGVEHEGASDGDALALAAGEHVRVAVVVFGPQPDLAEHLARLRLAFGRRHLRTADDEGFLEDRADPVARVQGPVRVLEDDLHALPKVPPAVFGDRFPVDLEGALGGRLDHGDEACKRGLSTPGLADHREGAPRLEGEARPGQCLHHAALAEEPAPDRVVSGQPLRGQHRLAHATVSGTLSG